MQDTDEHSDTHGEMPSAIMWNISTQNVACFIQTI